MVSMSTRHLDLHFLVELPDFLGIEEGICLFSTVALPYTFFLPINFLRGLQGVNIFCFVIVCFCLIFIPKKENILLKTLATKTI